MRLGSTRLKVLRPVHCLLAPTSVWLFTDFRASILRAGLPILLIDPACH